MSGLEIRGTGPNLIRPQSQSEVGPDRVSMLKAAWVLLRPTDRFRLEGPCSFGHCALHGFGCAFSYPSWSGFKGKPVILGDRLC